MERVLVCSLGRMTYDDAWALQQALVTRMVAAKRAAMPLPHVLLLVEHPHVFTLGKSGDRANLLLSEAELAARGASFRHIERGGDITYHGPGQLVAYPLLDLERFRPDLHYYLRALEEAVIRTCAEYGLGATRVDGRTGVWIGPDSRGTERKVCAMGIRCSRWITMHGLAFNLNTDLDYFSMIVPCGITDRGVTSLARELERPVDEAEAAGRLVRHLGKVLGAELQPVAAQEISAMLDSFAGDTQPS